MARGNRIVLLALASALLALLLAAGVASAHVTVEPREGTARGFQRYTVRVPTERDVPTISVRLEFPEGVTVSSFQPKPGWQREVERDAQQRIVAVTWSGGRIGPGEFDEFGFIARNPAEAGQIAWKAYQTYEGGELVEWTGPAGSEHPASVTTIRAAATEATGGTVEAPGQAAAPAQTQSAVSAGQPAAAPASAGSDLSLFLALGAAVLALLALVLAVAGLARRRAPEAA